MDMVWVPGGAFTMGSNDFYPEERPVHRVSVDGCLQAASTPAEQLAPTLH